MTRKPKPKPVKCWMMRYTDGFIVIYTNLVTPTELIKHFGGTITPGHFVPEKKARKR